MRSGKEGTSNVHANHRSRLKERFASDGLDSFQDHNVLEMLLFYSIPRYDTNEIAHNLLNEFGSLSNVMDADIEQLLKVPGIGKESAVFLRFISQFCRRYEIDRQKDIAAITCKAEAEKFFSPYFVGENEEVFMAVLLDGGFNIRKISVIDRGNEDSVFVNANRVFKDVVNHHASYVLLAHSHPYGFASPSREDKEITLMLAEKLRVLNVRLCDHLIFSKSEVYFMSNDRVFNQNRMFVFSEGKSF